MANTEQAQDLYFEFGGSTVGGQPAIHSAPTKTAGGTPYLMAAGVALLSRPAVNLVQLAPFIKGFPQFDGTNYVKDTLPDHGANLCKTAGQVCYLSFGDKRSKSTDASKYFANIMAQGHGSVLEHANYSFLFYGIDRAVTHELVRHRAGFAYSQVSQRYVDGAALRFVMRPEYLETNALQKDFERWIDLCRQRYDSRAAHLLQEQERQGATESRTARRKQVNQAARACLPNEVEAPILVTGNVRAWRHFIEARCNDHADQTIRRLAFRTFLCLAMEEPLLFGDYQIHKLGRGDYSVTTATRKV